MARRRSRRGPLGMMGPLMMQGWTAEHAARMMGRSVPSARHPAPKGSVDMFRAPRSELGIGRRR